MEKSEVNLLVKRTGRGDEEAFNELYDGLYAPLFSFLFPMLRSAEDVKDVIQDTFLEVVKGSRNKLFFFNCFGWIFTVARNKALNLVRVKKKGMCEEEIDELVFAAEGVEEQIELNGVLAMLKPQEEQALRLHYIDRMTFVEIGGVFQKSESWAKHVVYSALAKLREEYKWDGEV